MLTVNQIIYYQIPYLLNLHSYIGAEIVSACQEATMLAVEAESEGLAASYLESSIAEKISSYNMP